jgi:hypothetical protein
MRFVVCFFLLPWLPGLAIFIPAGHIAIVQDRIVVGVVVGVVVVLASGVLGGGVGHATLYAFATGALSIVAFIAIVAITWTTACGTGASMCS